MNIFNNCGNQTNKKNIERQNINEKRMMKVINTGQNSGKNNIGKQIINKTKNSSISQDDENVEMDVFNNNCETLDNQTNIEKQFIMIINNTQNNETTINEHQPIVNYNNIEILRKKSSTG